MRDRLGIIVLRVTRAHRRVRCFIDHPRLTCSGWSLWTCKARKSWHFNTWRVREAVPVAVAIKNIKPSARSRRPPIKTSSATTIRSRCLHDKRPKPGYGSLGKTLRNFPDACVASRELDDDRRLERRTLAVVRHILVNSPVSVGDVGLLGPLGSNRDGRFILPRSVEAPEAEEGGANGPA